GADDHADVDLGPRGDEEAATVRQLEDAVGEGLAWLHRDQRTVRPRLHLAGVTLVAVEDVAEHALALGHGEEDRAVAEQAAARDAELQPGPCLTWRHGDQRALTRRERLHDGAHR